MTELVDCEKKKLKMRAPAATTPVTLPFQVM
jgi:hypothetical protein